MKNNKTIYFLSDIEENSVDAVIIAKTSTSTDIKNAISQCKQIDGYTWDDLKNALPSDCEIFDRWDNETLYY